MDLGTNAIPEREREGVRCLLLLAQGTGEEISRAVDDGRGLKYMSSQLPFDTIVAMPIGSAKYGEEEWLLKLSIMTD
jgi:hypothetical protein